jgi:hypothetical protein
MTKNEGRIPPAFTRGMLLRSLLVGALIGLPLFFVRAPLWAFYVVPPIPMAPYIAWELLHLDTPGRRDPAAEAPERPRSRQASRSVA